MLRKIILVAATVALTACAADHPDLVASESPQITFGQVDSDNRYPYVGAIMVQAPDSNGGIPYPTCSGSLIHPQVFLTAAHCTDGIQQFLATRPGYQLLGVSFDVDPVAPGATLTGIDELITGPNYDHFSLQGDIGALILSEPVTGIEPVAVPEQNYLDQLLWDGELRGSYLTQSGYGGSLSIQPPIIYFGDKRQHADSKFRNLRGNFLQLQQTEANGNGGTCFGDSGGPVIRTDADGNDVAVGVVSWGDAMCVALANNYRTDNEDSVSFIASVLAGL